VLLAAQDAWSASIKICTTSGVPHKSQPHRLTGRATAPTEAPALSDISRAQRPRPAAAWQAGSSSESGSRSWMTLGFGTCVLGAQCSVLTAQCCSPAQLHKQERQAQIDRSFIAIDNSRPCTARTRRLPLIHSQCFNSRNRRRHSANVFPMQRLPGPQPHLRGPRPPPPPESVSRACLSDASVDLSQCCRRFFDTGLPQIQRPARCVTNSRRRLAVVTPSEFSLCCLGTLRAHEAEARRRARALVKQNGVHAGALCASPVS
jgi:hypothetical protein